MTAAHGTHDHADDPRNAEILINVNGRIVPRAEDTSRRVSGWLGATVVVFALVSALVTFLVLSGVTPVVPVHQVVVGVFVHISLDRLNVVRRLIRQRLRERPHVKLPRHHVRNKSRAVLAQKTDLPLRALDSGVDVCCGVV